MGIQLIGIIQLSLFICGNQLVAGLVDKYKKSANHPDADISRRNAGRSKARLPDRRPKPETTWPPRGPPQFQNNTARHSGGRCRWQEFRLETRRPCARVPPIASARPD